MKKVARNILIGLYFIITFVVTYCLLSYNKYNISEFKNKYLLVLEAKEYNYQKSDLLIVKKDSKYHKGDIVFYYDSYDSPVEVKVNKIKDIEKVDNNINVYKLENDLSFNDDNLLGTAKNTTSYSLIGAIYSVLTSKWGYLLIIIFPMLIAFVYEISQIIKELKR